MSIKIHASYTQHPEEFYQLLRALAPLQKDGTKWKSHPNGKGGRHHLYLWVPDRPEDEPPEEGTT